MNVLYVNHTGVVSGAERSLLGLLEALPHHVHARVACPRGDLADALAAIGVAATAITGTAGSLRLHPLHTPQALAELSLAAFQVSRAARRHGAAVVHGNSIRSGIVLGLARFSGPNPPARVVQVRDTLPPSAVSRATLRLIAATADAVVGNSAYTAERVRALAPKARLAVVHNGIDAARFDPARMDREAARRALGVAGTRRPLLGVVAQLTPWKGQDVAVEALRLLRERGLDAHLLLIGEAKFVARATRFDNEAYVRGLRERIAATGLEERVSWLGQRDDVPQLIRALDVLLLPSWEEPFGRAVIEAMALEVPVVATAVGGPPELLGDGREGYLVAPRDPEAWARAILAVVERDDGGAALGAAGRRRVLEAFTTQHMVAATLSVYDRALAARGAIERRA
jgi:glycosyltransferase involved in cell wall biosynthesis